MEAQREPARNISPERKAVYYAGLATALVGAILFVSVFVTGISHFGDFTNFEARSRSEGLRAVAGMVLMIAGGILAHVGSRGLAGSGVILDPERARKDVEPWSRLAGGVADDALSEVKVVEKIADRFDGARDGESAAEGREPAAAVKVRCRNCRALNDESAKFCDQCGAEL